MTRSGIPYTSDRCCAFSYLASTSRIGYTNQEGGEETGRWCLFLHQPPGWAGREAIDWHAG